MKPFSHPFFRKADKVIFFLVVPVLVVGILLYIFCSDPVFQLNEDYYFIRGNGNGEIRISGGKTVVSGGLLRLNGLYPYVYGICGDSYFIIDLQEHKCIVDSREQVQALLEGRKINLPPVPEWQNICLTWEELYRSPEGRDFRFQLKDRLSVTRKKK